MKTPQEIYDYESNIIDRYTEEFETILNNYEVAAGIINLANGYGTGAVDVVIGGVCIGVIPTREAKSRMWMVDGVKKYNSAIQD